MKRPQTRKVLGMATEISVIAHRRLQHSQTIHVALGVPVRSAATRVEDLLDERAIAGDCRKDVPSLLEAAGQLAELAVEARAQPFPLPKHEPSRTIELSKFAQEECGFD
jgi:hypothetical protein